MRSRSARVLFATVVTVLVAGILAGWLVTRQFFWTKQIRNLDLFRLYAACLNEYYQAHGTFPCSLSDATAGTKWLEVSRQSDVWGFPVHYESRGEAYILVSFGRDGRSEALDWWRLRELNDQSLEGRNTCFSWSADQVASDRGFHRCCGK